MKHPDGLLEFLIAQQEAIVHKASQRELTIPTQLACFSSVPKMVMQLGKEQPEFAEAAVAGRFLILRGDFAGKKCRDLY